MSRRAIVAGLALLAAACASLRGRPVAVALTPADLLAGNVLGVGAESSGRVPDENVLALSPEMRAFLAAHVSRSNNPDVAFHELVSSIMNPSILGVKYDDTTQSASDTFRTRRGNCLSFSNMFVAMAREVGLNVQYEEVETPPDWTLDKDTFVLNQHINVFVDLGRDGSRVVDFNVGDLKASYETRRISDARALAHYFNNIGVERMLAGDIAGALACFRKAIAEGDRRFAPAWTNLGTLFLRSGHPAHAEAAFLEALKTNESDLVAMSNLERLYDQLGDQKRAAAYQKRVAHDRWRNPYYRYQLARQAFADHNYALAIKHLKYAVRQHPDEDSFCLLLGQSYRAKGDEKAATRWLTRADEVAAANAAKRRRSAAPLQKDTTSP